MSDGNNGGKDRHIANTGQYLNDSSPTDLNSDGIADYSLNALNTTVLTALGAYAKNGAKDSIRMIRCSSSQQVMVILPLVAVRAVIR